LKILSSFFELYCLFYKQNSACRKAHNLEVGDLNLSTAANLIWTLNFDFFYLKIKQLNIEKSTWY